MNDLLYYEPLADLLKGDPTYQVASAQVRFGYLTLAVSFRWNLPRLPGNVSPTLSSGAAQRQGQGGFFSLVW
jgi:hypothetical protein